MARISWSKVANNPNLRFHEALFARGLSLPKKVTLNQLVKRWIMTNCSGQWSSVSLPRGAGVLVVFFDAGDFALAQTTFAPNTPFRSRHPGSLGGFRYP